MAGTYFEQLARALGDDPPLSRPVAEAATGGRVSERLRGLAETLRSSDVATGPAAYDETAAEAAYDDLAALRTDLDLLLAVEDAPAEAERLLGMQSYMRRAMVPELDPDVDQHELAIDRRLLLQRLAPSLALDATNQLDELAASFDIFRRRYIELYVRRHTAYHAMVATWRAEFTREHATRPEELRLFNEVSELEAPVGTHLWLRAEQILASVAHCEVAPEQLRSALAGEPRCSFYDLDLMATPPSAEVAQWHDDCVSALRLQQHRLARAAVARAMDMPARPAIDRLLRVVQASDVRPLIDVMDESLQSLIRELLAAGD